MKNKINMTDKGEHMTIYDTNNINLDLLKQYNNSLNKEKTNFINKTYGTFSSSYLKTADNIYVKNMAVVLEKLYKKIELDYSSVLTYLNSYIENTSALEYVLSGESGSSFISENVVRNFVDSKLLDLPNIK